MKPTNIRVSDDDRNKSSHSVAFFARMKSNFQVSQAFSWVLLAETNSRTYPGVFSSNCYKQKADRWWSNLDILSIFLGKTIYLWKNDISSSFLCPSNTQSLPSRQTPSRYLLVCLPLYLSLSGIWGSKLLSLWPLTQQVTSSLFLTFRVKAALGKRWWTDLLGARNIKAAQGSAGDRVASLSHQLDGSSRVSGDLVRGCSGSKDPVVGGMWKLCCKALLSPFANPSWVVMLFLCSWMYSVFTFCLDNQIVFIIYRN